MTIKSLTGRQCSNRHIARLLGVTEGTVRYHRRRQEAGTMDGRSGQQPVATRFHAAIDAYVSASGEEPPSTTIHRVIARCSAMFAGRIRHRRVGLDVVWRRRPGFRPKRTGRRSPGSGSEARAGTCSRSCSPGRSRGHGRWCGASASTCSHVRQSHRQAAPGGSLRVPAPPARHRDGCRALTPRLGTRSPLQTSSAIWRWYSGGDDRRPGARPPAARQRSSGLGMR